MEEIDNLYNKDNHNEYVIITPNHKLNTEYKNNGYNSVLIHHYEFNERMLYKELKTK